MCQRRDNKVISQWRAPSSEKEGLMFKVTLFYSPVRHEKQAKQNQIAKNEVNTESHK